MTHRLIIRGLELILLAAWSWGLAGCLSEDQLRFEQASSEVERTGSAAVSLTMPTGGAVDFPLEVSVAVQGFTLSAAVSEEASSWDSGHWHLEVDGVMDGAHYASSTAIVKTLAGGAHALQARLVAGDESDLDPPVVSAAVTVQVDPEIEVVSPADQARISGPVTLEVTVEDFLLSQETEGEAQDGYGHYHVYVDSEYLTACFELTCEIGPLSEGGHQLMVELADSNHYALNPTVTDIIEVTAVAQSAD